MESRDEAREAARAAWEAPELRRVDAGDAEGAGGTGDDSGVFS